MTEVGALTWDSSPPFGKAYFEHKLSLADCVVQAVKLLPVPMLRLEIVCGEYALNQLMCLPESTYENGKSGMKLDERDVPMRRDRNLPSNVFWVSDAFSSYIRCTITPHARTSVGGCAPRLF